MEILWLNALKVIIKIISLIKIHYCNSNSNKPPLLLVMKVKIIILLKLLLVLLPLISILSKTNPKKNKK